MTSAERMTTSFYLDELDLSRINWAFQLTGGSTASWAGLIQYLECSASTGYRAARRAIASTTIEDNEDLSRSLETLLRGPRSRRLEPLDEYVRAFQTITQHIPWTDTAPGFTHLLALHILHSDPVAWAVRDPDESDWAAPVKMWTSAPETLEALIRGLEPDRERLPSRRPEVRAIWRRGKLEVSTFTERRPASVAVRRKDHARTKQLFGNDLLPRITNVAAHGLSDMTYWLDPVPAINLVRSPDTTTDLRTAARDLVHAFERYLRIADRDRSPYLFDAIRRAEASGADRLQHAVDFFNTPSWTAKLADYEPEPHVSDDAIRALDLAILCDIDLDQPSPVTEADIARALHDRAGWNGDPSITGAASLVALLESRQHPIRYHCAAEYHVHELVTAYLEECTPTERTRDATPAHAWIARAWPELHTPLATIWRWIDPDATYDSTTRTITLKLSRTKTTTLTHEQGAWLHTHLDALVPLNPHNALKGWTARWLKDHGKSQDTNDATDERTSITLDADFTTILLTLATQQPSDARGRIEALLRERASRH